jgi:DNA/RNA endonuclease G (NUC1)
MQVAVLFGLRYLEQSWHKAKADALNGHVDIYSTYFPSKDSYYLRKESSSNFKICYDTRTSNPKWVIEHLRKNDESNSSDNRTNEQKQRPNFFSESKIDELFRVSKLLFVLNII